MASRRSQHDKEMAAVLKERKEERRSGVCCICYATVGNDTHGGRSVMEHYSRHARGFEEDRRKIA